MNLMHLLDDEKCFQVVRERRWPEGVRCPHCTSPHVIKQGRDDTQRARQRSLGVKSGEEVGKRVCKPTVGLGEHGAKGIQATSEEAFGRVAVSKAA